MSRLLLGVAVAVAAYSPPLASGTLASQQVLIDPDDIGGIVTGPNGPEAGVWVIAETTELPTKFVRVVVTDDRGRYVLPDLPSATFDVWVRGYGLVDSPKKRARPGSNLDHSAVPATRPTVFWQS